MNKNESMRIRPIKNGFTIEHEYRMRNPTTKDPDNWDYVEDFVAFTSWDEVIKWMVSNPLTFPPVTI